MRYLLVLLLLASCTTDPKQNESYTAKVIQTSIQRKAVSDTTFLYREVTPEYYHKVYIERNRQSEVYKRLLDFRPNDDERKYYQECCKKLRQITNVPSQQFKLIGLPKEWLPLYRYHGKYYVYAPSEWGGLERKTITDSTMVYWFMDGPSPEPLLGARKLSSNTYYLKIHTSGASNLPAKLTIHIIDAKNKIAVWEDQSASIANRYNLYVPRENARNFDMVVNYCKEQRTDEFEFDKVDYTALLNSSQ
ncbi:hypothetical protein HH214_15910 [Mucilaginibacter robiniae]|uniref:Uncharacterized protein n=1 Tax=Mucilaginibacter robiniae TaxID=2728022 RepID=A0A7L5E3R7_9SPHI|nr:hypothetical protein [Mucilaginibacter robiniae]QJD97248.1 hypothetical protein HH214_15910 [Mucilaginibacter robiniae]